MRPVAGAEGFGSGKIDAQEFAEGAIRITKGLLCEYISKILIILIPHLRLWKYSQEASKTKRI